MFGLNYNSGKTVLTEKVSTTDPLCFSGTTDLEKIKAYIDSFRYGAPPHGGGGIGEEYLFFWESTGVLILFYLAQMTCFRKYYLNMCVSKATGLSSGF